MMPTDRRSMATCNKAIDSVQNNIGGAEVVPTRHGLDVRRQAEVYGGEN